MYNNQPTILITRPLPEAYILSDLLQQHHFSTVIYPTIKIVPTLNKTKLTKKFNFLHRYQMIIFNSLNAVRITGKVFNYAYFKLATPPKIYAVGKTTAQSLLQLGFNTVIYPKTTFSSASLVQLLQASAFNKPCKALLVSGEKGLSNQFIKNLSSLGIAVTVLPCYKRTCPPGLHSNSWREWAVQGVTHIVVTSQDALNNLWYTQKNEEGLKFIRQSYLVTFSSRIAHYAQTLKIDQSQISITKEASNEGILEFFKYKFPVNTH